MLIGRTSSSLLPSALRPSFMICSLTTLRLYLSRAFEISSLVQFSILAISLAKILFAIILSSLALSLFAIWFIAIATSLA